MVLRSKKKSPHINSNTEMHHQVHRTGVVAELDGRQSISLVARSTKIKIAPQLYMSLIHM